jgi:hypothetical protein
MDTKFRSSFIPKATLSEHVEERQSTGFFGVVAIALFALSLLSTAAFFGYKMMLRSEVRNLKSQLASAEAAVDRAAINEIISFDKRLRAVKQVITQHVAISSFLAMLESTTASQVQFTDLKFTSDPRGNISTQMGGKAKSYAVIALQEDSFVKDPNTVSANFGDLKADAKTGIVSFTFKGEFKKGLIDFRSTGEEELGADTELDLGDDLEADLDNI